MIALLRRNDCSRTSLQQVLTAAKNFVNRGSALTAGQKRGLQKLNDSLTHSANCRRNGVPIKLRSDGVICYLCPKCKFVSARGFTKDERVVMNLLRHNRNCSRVFPPKWGILLATGRACFECRDCGRQATNDPSRELILRNDI